MKTLPTLSHDGTDGGGRPAAPVSRRAFVSAATLSVIGAALASACSGGGDGPTGVITPPTTGVTVSGSVITIDLAQVPALEAADGFILVSRPSTLVIRTGTDAYRAFTSVCTHEQCTVGDYRGGRIVCPCHGSQYDSSGQVVVGPATRPLREFAVALDAEARVLTVTAT